MAALQDRYEFTEVAVDSDDEHGRSYIEGWASTETGLVYLYAEDEGPKPVTVAMSVDEARDLMSVLERAIEVAESAESDEGGG